MSLATCCDFLFSAGLTCTSVIAPSGSVCDNGISPLRFSGSDGVIASSGFICGSVISLPDFTDSSLYELLLKVFTGTGGGDPSSSSEDIGNCGNAFTGSACEWRIFAFGGTTFAYDVLELTGEWNEHFK